MVRSIIGKIKLASLGLLVAAVPYLGCGSEGIPVKGNYPELTPGIKSRLEERVLELAEANSRIVEDASGLEEGDVVPFDGVPKEFLNYFIDFTQEDYVAKGISMSGLEGVTLSLCSQEEVKQVCGRAKAVGCNNGFGHITMRDDLNIAVFLSIFGHEFGHRLYFQNLELPSMANQTYSPIKLYEFSKRIGSLMIYNSFHGCYSESLEEMEPFPKMYPKGGIFAVLNLGDHEADIEQAMEYVTHTRLLAIETKVDNAVSEYGTSNPIEICFQAWESLLSSPQFASSIVNSRHGLTLSEARELAEYMRLLNYSVSRSVGSGERDDEYHRLVEEFLNLDFVSNPYFKAHAVIVLNERNYNDINELTVSGELVSGEIYGLAKGIIDANQEYPCTVEDPYECPRVVRGIMPRHVFAYYVSNYAAFNGDDEERKDESLSYAVDFITRFYPGVDFDNGDFTALAVSDQVQTNSYVPPIATQAGIYAFKSYPDVAEKLFAAAVAVKCEGQVVTYTDNRHCNEWQMVAQSYLDFIKGK